MSEYAKFASNAGDQYLSALAEAQDTFLKSITPYTQMAASMPQVPAPHYAPELPTMAEIAEANFAFASKLLKQQKKFAEKLFAATSPQE